VVLKTQGLAAAAAARLLLLPALHPRSSASSRWRRW
jgi:hypothetical protein